MVNSTVSAADCPDLRMQGLDVSQPATATDRTLPNSDPKKYATIKLLIQIDTTTFIQINYLITITKHIFTTIFEDQSISCH